jgi:hypothetical protein
MWASGWPGRLPLESLLLYLLRLFGVSGRLRAGRSGAGPGRVLAGGPGGRAPLALVTQLCFPGAEALPRHPRARRLRRADGAHHPSSQAHRQMAAEAAEGRVRTGADSARVRVAPTNWWVLVEQPEDEALAAVYAALGRDGRFRVHSSFVGWTRCPHSDGHVSGVTSAPMKVSIGVGQGRKKTESVPSPHPLSQRERGSPRPSGLGWTRSQGLHLSARSASSALNHIRTRPFPLRPIQTHPRYTRYLRPSGAAVYRRSLRVVYA